MPCDWGWGALELTVLVLFMVVAMFSFFIVIIAIIMAALGAIITTGEYAKGAVPSRRESCLQCKQLHSSNLLNLAHTWYLRLPLIGHEEVWYRMSG